MGMRRVTVILESGVTALTLSPRNQDLVIEDQTDKTITPTTTNRVIAETGIKLPTTIPPQTRSPLPTMAATTIQEVVVV